MAVITFATLDGEVVSESRVGTRKDFLPDPLGSTAAMLDSSQTKTDTWTYWPYGEERTRTGTTPTPFQFVGTFGYYEDSATRVYIRARSYRAGLGSWMTADPLWPSEMVYAYVSSSPATNTDPSGLQFEKLQFGKPDWIPPINSSEDDHLCNGRKPRPTSQWGDEILIPCAICLYFANVEADSSGGGWDKENHFIGGCLARIRCGGICPDSVGTYKELSDSYSGGTVSRADALATDDGWDHADWWIRKFSRDHSWFADPFPKGDVAFCQAAAKRSIWKWRPPVNRKRKKKQVTGF